MQTDKTPLDVLVVGVAAHVCVCVCDVSQARSNQKLITCAHQLQQLCVALPCFFAKIYFLNREILSFLFRKQVQLNFVLMSKMLLDGIPLKIETSLG